MTKWSMSMTNSLMVKYFQFISIIGLVVFLGFSIFASVVFAQGLVPCGPGIAANPSCDVCDFFSMADDIIKFITTKAVPLVAVILVVVGGVMWMFSAGSEERIKKGKAILTSTIVGLIIVYTSWILIDTIFKKIAGQQFESKFGPWNELKCQ